MTGKNAKDLRQDANEIRSQWFAGVLARQQEEKSAVEAALPELQNKLNKYRQQLAAAEAEAQCEDGRASGPAAADDQPDAV